MQLTFGEILTQLFNHYGLDYSNQSAQDIKAVKNLVNFIQDDVCNRLKYWWRKELKEFETVATYSTGTITIATSSGVSTVTGTDTVWTSSMEGYRFVVDGEKVAYKVDTVASGTSLTLERIYINPSGQTNTLATASSYNISKDQYLMDRDFVSFVYQTLRDVDEETNLTVVDIVEFDQDYPAPYDTDNPTMVIFRGLTQSSFYNTGTVTIATAAGISTVTGSGTTFTSAMVGKTFRVEGESREYTIATYSSGVSITITPKYVNPEDLANTLATATNYDIDPAGSVMLDLYPFPIYQTHMRGWAFCKLKRLVENLDISLIPDHKALMSGSLWQMGIFKKDTYDKILERKNEYKEDIDILKQSIPVIPKLTGVKVRLKGTGKP